MPRKIQFRFDKTIRYSILYFGIIPNSYGW